MQIDIMSGASPNGAPATESTGASSEATTAAPGSFADLLNAAAEEPTESTPADDGDDEESDEEGWPMMPLFVPFVPVVPQEVVECQDGDVTSVDAIGEEVAPIDTTIDAPEVAPAAGSTPFMRDDETLSPESKQPGLTATGSSPPVTPAIESFSAQPAGDVRPDVKASDVESTIPTVSREAQGHPIDSVAKEPTAKPGKGTKSTATPKVPDVTEVTRPATAERLPSAAPQAVLIESVAVRAESSSNTTPGEPASNSKGIAARFARALERATESSASPNPAATGENGQSFDQGGDSQPSFGEWLREQRPQMATGRGQAVTAPTFNVVAPMLNDVRIAGVLTPMSGQAMPTAPGLAGEQDVTLQIVQSLRLQFRDGIGEAVLKLKPEHLGAVSISLRIENGGLKANVQADVPAVRQWLESQQDTLRSALAEHNLRLDRFDVEPDGQRQAPREDAPDQRSRKRQPRRSAQADEPVFEVVV